MFKKIKLLLFYIKTIKQYKNQLKNENGLMIDWVWRLYKTHTIPPDEIDDVKQFGTSYLEELIKKDIFKIEKKLDSIGLLDLHTLKEVIELNDRQIGISFEFKPINTAKLINNCIWTMLYIIGIILGFILVSFSGIIYATVSILFVYIIRRIILSIFN